MAFIRQNSFLFQFILWLSIIVFSSSSFANERPNTSPPFPYELSLATDIPIGLLSSGTFITGLVLTTKVDRLTQADIETLNAKDVNSFDRSATRRWSIPSARTSDVILATFGVAPLFLLLPQIKQKKWLQAVTIGLMYLEAITLSLGVTSIFKGAIKRIRPFNYNHDLSIDTRLDVKHGNLSFFSGHSSTTFCTALFISKVITDLYPNSKLKYVVWPVSLSLATTTGILRYTAGKHFPTDILTGAAVGGLIGFLIPVLHKKHAKEKISLLPIYNSSYKGISASFTF